MNERVPPVPYGSDYVIKPFNYQREAAHYRGAENCAEGDHQEIASDIRRFLYPPGFFMVDGEEEIRQRTEEDDKGH